MNNKKLTKTIIGSNIATKGAQAIIKVPSSKLKVYLKTFKNKGQAKTVKIKKQVLYSGPQDWNQNYGPCFIYKKLFDKLEIHAIIKL